MTIPATDPLDYVQGINGRYHCPNLDTLDGHIRALTERIKRSDGHAPITVRRLLADVDTLLERRLYLSEMEQVRRL